MFCFGLDSLRHTSQYVNTAEFLVLDNNKAVVKAIDNAEEAETANNNEIQTNTNNSNNNKFEAAVDNFVDINVTGAADDNLDEITVEIL